MPSPPSTPHDCLTIKLADGREIAIPCVRDPRARRIKLLVTPRGPRLTLPLRVSLSAGGQFVEQHRDWLAAHVQDTTGTALIHRHTTHLPLRGEHLPLRWETGRFVQLQQVHEHLQFSLPATVNAAAIARAVRDFYEAEARADIARWLPTYLPELPRPPARIRLRALSSQWGSLAADDTLTLDLALVLGQPFAFEHVLVHELCHLIHRNHSHHFWHEVERRDPHRARTRDYFRHKGRALKAQLHALLHVPTE